MPRKVCFLFYIILGLSNISFIFAADEFDTVFKGNVRPVSALQIERAKEEGIDPALLIHEISTIQEEISSPAQTIVNQRPVNTNRPTRPRHVGNVEQKPVVDDPFRSIEQDLRAFIIPDDLKGLKLLHNLDDYIRLEDKKMDLNEIAVNYALSNMKVSNFSLSPISGVNLVIINGTVLIQGTKDLEIKKDFHVINIIGRENRFQVTKKVTISGDAVNSGLFLAEGAELIFEFINDGSTTPEVFLADDFVMNMPKNAVLRFEGEGVVKFGNGARINLNGQRDADKLENVVFSNKPIIHVSKLACLTTEVDGSAIISGIGTVEITKGGKILIDQPGHLIFGHEIMGADVIDYPYVDLVRWNDSTESYDDENVKRMYFENSSSVMLDIKVIDSGLIQLSNSGVVSLAYSKSTLELKQGGMLAIKNGGEFEINLDNTEVAGGLLSLFHFGPGAKLSIDDTGKLSMAANLYDSTMVDVLGHTMEYYVNWSAKDATTQGDGLIGYTDQQGGNDRSFIGKFQPANAIYNKTDEELEKLSEKLVNTNTNADVNVTIVYTDQNDVAKFRTVNGVSVVISTGFTVISDDSLVGSSKYGQVTLKNSTKQKLVYDKDGNQVV